MKRPAAVSTKHERDIGTVAYLKNHRKILKYQLQKTADDVVKQEQVVEAATTRCLDNDGGPMAKADPGKAKYKLDQLRHNYEYYQLEKQRALDVDGVMVLDIDGITRPMGRDA